MPDNRNRQTSRLNMAAGPFSLQAKLSVTPTGLLSIAALVGTVLLTTAVLVQAARK